MKGNQLRSYWLVTLLISGLLAGCAGAVKDNLPAASAATSEPAAAVNDATVQSGGGQEHSSESDVLELPALQPVDLQGGKLRVIATTSIIGDVVAQVGGEAIDLTTLMSAGQDPHSYQPGARELTAVADAQVIFVNGWDLEEALVGDLANIGGNVPIVPVSAHIVPLAFDHSGGSEEEHAHGNIDPHVWLSVPNVEQWVENIRQTLQSLDPDNEQVYEENAAAYLSQLAELQTDIEKELAAIPAAKRFLVTNHEAFGYFAQAYNFQIVGTVIPASSTLAEPSASDLTDLVTVMQAHHICTIFTETTVS
ncbi:MAG: metal ABC transporter substrate-binding protein, partial [Anaerolineae bacterium]